ncbi:sulfurtransferase [Endozoicomonas arenosclerae]|uniref:sulfurtransferase n=1 Tax=Endozoicomonas arenosclerae TaxID=1633495 RepID=UPI000783BC22|nr:sulfurtransferase [Endozoicomonas arenosclerae]
MSPFIEPEVLATLLNDPKVVVLDARFSLADPKLGQTLYSQGHVPGARYIDLEKDLSAPVVPGKTSRHPLPAPDVFAERVRAFGIKKDSHVVVYDDGGHAMAARAWWQLRWIGVKCVQVLHGGFKSWSAGRYPVTTDLPEVSASDFIEDVDHSLTVSANEVMEQLQNPVYRLIDARAPERFAGEVEPLDKKAGHIPGAVCHPFTSNMDDSGSFLPAEQLQQQLGRLMVEGLQPVFYCGSGVTACHNLLAMEYAGMKGAKLYPGSWSEWITDESRPIATGLE